MATTIQGTWPRATTPAGDNSFDGKYLIQYKERTADYVLVHFELDVTVVTADTDRCFKLYVIDSYGEWGMVNKVNSNMTQVYKKGTTVHLEHDYHIYNINGSNAGSWVSKIAFAADRGGSNCMSTNKDFTLDYPAWLYSIKFNANGGSNAPATVTKQLGKSVNLPVTKPVFTGYTFQGWSTSASGSVAYQPGGAFTRDADTTLYAIWKVATYTISYNANGGSGAPSNQTKTYNVTITLSSIRPTRTGYTFQGWATTSAGSAAYQPGATYVSNANLQLYAVWKANTFTITYNANSGTGAPAKQTKTYGVDLKLSSSTPTRSGYQFLGWATSAQATKATYKAGATFTMNANTTLYAVWQENSKVFLTLKYQNGTGIEEFVELTSGKESAIPTDKPTKANTSATYTVRFDKVESEATISKTSATCTRVTGYTFTSWNTKADGTGTTYTAGQRITLTKDLTLYAIYRASTTGTVALPTGTYEGYELKGWSTSIDTVNLVPNPYSATANITLYAVWGGNGLGGMLKFPSSYSVAVNPGDKVRLLGFKDSENDGLYTVASSSTKNNMQTIFFEEDFASSGTQKTSEFELQILTGDHYVPDFDYICASNNRLYGCSSKNRTIYASALGDPTDFYTFEGTTLDAYQVAVGSAGDFTGCIALNNSVLFMKQHCIHKLLGDFPAEYALYTYNNEGTSESNGMTLANYQNTAVYVSEHGVSSYNGSVASVFSKALGEDLMRNGVGSICGNEYMLSVQDKNDQYHAYSLDLEHNIWLDKGDGEVLCYAHLDSDDFAVIRQDDKNHIYQLNGTKPIDEDWQITFKPFYESVSGSYKSTSHVFEKKRYTHITVRLELPVGSWIQADIRADGLPWQKAARMAGKHNGVQDFVIRTPRCDSIQLRLKGHGAMTIIAIDRTYLTGSRR